MDTARHDVPLSVFPFLVELWGPGADRRARATWYSYVIQPGPMQIPGLGLGTWVRITYADGSVEIEPPPGATMADW